MSAAQCEEFLAGVHIGVLSAAVGTAGRTLTVSVGTAVGRPAC